VLLPITGPSRVGIDALFERRVSKNSPAEARWALHLPLADGS